MISIIVPVYNGEKYLVKTISDILGQSYKNIELILVNDGSSDSSLEICKKIAMVDERVKVLNKPNGGICSARNYGIVNSTGDYISFVDQDDQIDPCMYSIFSSGIEENADLVVAGKEMNEIDTYGNIIKHKIINPESKIVSDIEQMIKLAFNADGTNELLHLWNCLYRSSIIKDNDIFFEEMLKSGLEDSLFNINYALHCNNISFQKGIVYHYYNRHGLSTSAKKNPSYIKDFEIFGQNAVKNIEKNTLRNTKEYLASYLYRLAYNLFHRCKNDTDISDIEQLAKLFKISNTLTGTRYVKRYTVPNIINYIYINTMNFTIRHKMNSLLCFIINLKDRIYEYC